MKVISFFSRITVICNCCFLLFIFVGRLKQKTITPVTDKVVPVPFFKDIIITLGISAILINLLMCIVYSGNRYHGEAKSPSEMAGNGEFSIFDFTILYFFFR